MPEPILSLRGISKSYGALQVLRNVDLDVRPGEVVALLGREWRGQIHAVRHHRRISSRRPRER